MTNKINIYKGKKMNIVHHSKYPNGEEIRICYGKDKDAPAEDVICIKIFGEEWWINCDEALDIAEGLYRAVGNYLSDLNDITKK